MHIRVQKQKREAQIPAATILTRCFKDKLHKASMLLALGLLFALTNIFLQNPWRIQKKVRYSLLKDDDQ